MSKPYLLDFMLNEGHLAPELQKSKNPLWVSFKIDGNDQQVVSSSVTPCSNPKWEFCVRALLHLSDLGSAYVFVNLCTVDENTNQPKTIGHAKIGLKAFPVGNPRKFTFSVMSVANYAIQIAQLHLTATISAFVPAFHSAPTPTMPYQRPAPSRFVPGKPRFM